MLQQAYTLYKVANKYDRVNNPQTLQAFKGNIQQEIADPEQEMLGQTLC